MALSFRRAFLRTSRKDLALRLATPSQYPGNFSGYLRDVVCCRRDQVMRFCSLAFGWDREACLAAALACVRSAAAAATAWSYFALAAAEAIFLSASAPARLRLFFAAGLAAAETEPCGQAVRA